MLTVSDIEVVEPASDELTTVSALKSSLEIADDSKDSLLSRLLSEASAEIRSYTQRSFLRERVREFLPASGSHYLTLSRTPVTEVHSVLLDSEPVVSWELWDKGAGFLYRSVGWQAYSTGLSLWWPSNSFRAMTHSSRFVVEYTGGYVAPGEDGRDLPADIEAAAIEMARNAYLNSGSEREVQSVQARGLSVKFADAGADMPSSVKNKLSRYVRVV